VEAKRKNNQLNKERRIQNEVQINRAEKSATADSGGQAVRLAGE
jgi:hypothetical protein